MLSPQHSICFQDLLGVWRSYKWYFTGHLQSPLCIQSPLTYFGWSLFTDILITGIQSSPPLLEGMLVILHEFV